MRASANEGSRWQPLRVVTLPMPGPIYFEAQRLPPVCNFYIANRVVVRLSHAKMRGRCCASGFVPRAPVIGIDCTELVWGLGAIHCVTQQQRHFLRGVFASSSSLSLSG